MESLKKQTVVSGVYQACMQPQRGCAGVLKVGMKCREVNHVCWKVVALLPPRYCLRVCGPFDTNLNLKHRAGGGQHQYSVPPDLSRNQENHENSCRRRRAFVY